MNQFTTKYADCIQGVISGFDRLVFHGTLRTLASLGQMMGYLSIRNVPLKDFGTHAQLITNRLKAASLSCFEEAGRPVRYLPSTQVSKEDLARDIAAQDGITEGLVCAFTSVEPCRSFDVRGNIDGRRPELVQRYRKCLYLYHYSIHPVFGFMNARIQTWFPFAIQVCINGREWLARQMQQNGVNATRRDNCFVYIADYAQAQALLDAQLRVHWPNMLDAIAKQLHPCHDDAFAPFVARYYWTCHQSEWATDLVFRPDAGLDRLFPKLVTYGMTGLSSADILRFLGQRLNLNGDIPAAFRGQVKTDFKRRQEGVRIKHGVNHNAIKAYNKAQTTEGNVLRIETTLNDPADFKVYRPKEGGSPDDLEWRPLRKGVADLYRRAVVCQNANERYIDALASADNTQTLEEVLQAIVRPTTWKGRPVRALSPFSPDDRALLDAVGHGEFAINGLRNRDLQRLLYAKEPQSPEEVRRRSGSITRKLRLLRAHGILAKVPHTHRYQVTTFGRQVLTAVLMALKTPITQFDTKAA